MSLLNVKFGNKVYLAKYESPKPTVTIGGRKYPIVQIGRQWWMAENLALEVGDYKYYLDDKSNYLYKGCYYSGYAITNVASNIPNGWRIPTENDFNSLISVSGSTSQEASSNLRSVSTWTTPGTNRSGFDAKSFGRYNKGSSTWYDAGCIMWTSNQISLPTTPDVISTGFRICDISNSSISITDAYINWMQAIRLCKDATVNIGGRDYPTTRIGNQVWLAENLDWKIDGVEYAPPGVPSTPAAWYYDNSESYQSTGLLYNWYSVAIINAALPDGWRVPSTADFDILAENVGGTENAGRALKSTTDWASYLGTDKYGFTALPTGFRNIDGLYPDRLTNQNTNYWITEEFSSVNGAHIRVNASTNELLFLDSKKERGYSIRLVKNI